MTLDQTDPTDPIDLASGRDPGWTLAAEKSIQRVQQDHLFGLDQRDSARFLRAYHPDASLSLDDDVYTGHGQLEELLSVLWARATTTMHVSGDYVLDLVSETAATGRGHLGITGVTSAGEPFMASAYWPSDRFECRDGVWRIARRQVVLTMLTMFPPAGCDIKVFGPDAERLP